MIDVMNSVVPVYKFTMNISTDDLIKNHLYSLSLDKGLYPEDGELDVLLHLYNSGPIVSRESNKSFLKSCVDKGLRRSEASTRNVLSKYTSLGILVKEKNSHRRFNYDLIPNKITGDTVFEYIVSNIDLNAYRTKENK